MISSKPFDRQYFVAILKSSNRRTWANQQRKLRFQYIWILEWPLRMHPPLHHHPIRRRLSCHPKEGRRLVKLFPCLRLQLFPQWLEHSRRALRIWKAGRSQQLFILTRFRPFLNLGIFLLSFWDCTWFRGLQQQFTFLAPAMAGDGWWQMTFRVPFYLR